jgi:hypothetical protein
MLIYNHDSHAKWWLQIIHLVKKIDPYPPYEAIGVQ